MSFLYFIFYYIFKVTPVLYCTFSKNSKIQNADHAHADKRAKTDGKHVEAAIDVKEDDVDDHQYLPPRKTTRPISVALIFELLTAPMSVLMKSGDANLATVVRGLNGSLQAGSDFSEMGVTPCS